MTNTDAAPIFLPLVTYPGYWVGVANHACAAPEFVPGGTFIQEGQTADFCPGVALFRPFESLCPDCQAKDDAIPF